MATTIASVMATKPRAKDGPPTGLGDIARDFVGEEAEPHYAGHRERLRERFVLGGPDANAGGSVFRAGGADEITGGG